MSHVNVGFRDLDPDILGTLLDAAVCGLPLLLWHFVYPTVPSSQILFMVILVTPQLPFFFFVVLVCSVLEILVFSWLFLISVFSLSFSASTSKTQLSILSTLLCRLSITRCISALNWLILSFVASEFNFMLKTSRVVTVDAIFVRFLPPRP